LHAALAAGSDKCWMLTLRALHLVRCGGGIPARRRPLRLLDRLNGAVEDAASLSAASRL
jgi:hypothetical protein